MKVIDLIAQPNSALWENTVSEIIKTKDELLDNYINLDFSKFLCFPCVVKDERIIAFSGLQIDDTKWGKGIARCSSRMWIHPNYRIKTLKKFSHGQSFLNSFYCVPQQIEIAKFNNISVLFVSREKNSIGFLQYLKLLTNNTKHKFIMENDRYWVCGPVRHDSCLQYVGICYLTSDGVVVWNENMKKNIYGQ